MVGRGCLRRFWCSKFTCVYIHICLYTYIHIYVQEPLQGEQGLLAANLVLNMYTLVLNMCIYMYINIYIYMYTGALKW